MSVALYKIGGLRFWHEKEIVVRENSIRTLHLSLLSSLTSLNPAWSFYRTEGPLLTPREFINSAYEDSDIFSIQGKLAGDDYVLRAETTASSYLYAEWLLQNGLAKAPLCVWQVGKSFRREPNDGARASELRFNEFYQIEFQCIFNISTKADIRSCVETSTVAAIQGITHSSEIRMVNSDRLPAYSTQTSDVEVMYKHKWKEMCSISTRTDFPLPNMSVVEVAIGLDRLVVVEASRFEKE